MNPFLEEICEIAEKAAREYIMSRVPARRISSLDVDVDTEGVKPVRFSVEVDLTLSPLVKDSADDLAEKAVEKAFMAIREHLRELSCKSTK